MIPFLKPTLTLVVLGMCSFACGGETESLLSKRSSVAVDLPAKPTLHPPTYVREHPDGVLTVEGLLRDPEPHVGRDIQVRGRVDALVLCKKRPARQAPGEAGDPTSDAWICASQPHAFLVDRIGDKRHRLRLAGSMESRLSSLTIGEQVDLRGTFDLVSPQGKYVDQHGLLFLPSVARSGAVLTPKATQ